MLSPEGEDQDCYSNLAALKEQEFLYERPAFPESEYLFKHALTLDVAYETVLPEKREVIQKRTARAMDVLYNGNPDDRYRELAHH